MSETLKPQTAKKTRRQATPPRTFVYFPEDSICPACGTNDDGLTVLVAIDGTQDGYISEAKPFHLGCAIAEQYTNRVEGGLIYRRCGQGSAIRAESKAQR